MRFRRRELGVFFVFQYVLGQIVFGISAIPRLHGPRPLAARSFTFDFEKFFQAQKSPPFETETLLKSDLWSLERIISSFFICP